MIGPKRKGGRPLGEGTRDAMSYGITRRQIKILTLAFWNALPSELAKRVIANECIRHRENC